MTTAQRILTGITPSGVPHIGNYIGCIKPALQSQGDGNERLFFIADYHSLVKQWDAKARKINIYEIAATWLALGLDPSTTILYRQSAIPEIAELNWILTSIAAKGLLNRAHAYKDKVAVNLQDKQDADYAITMGLYCYPILMTADILAFNAEKIPVGKDQVQHIEIARDLASRFNHIYKSEVFCLPEAVVDEQSKVIPGRDGRKMSKSYDNTIPIFLPAKQLRKNIMKITTNSQLPEEPKSIDDSTIFEIYKAIANEKEVADLAAQYASGIGWGDAKQILFESLDSLLEEPRERYEELMADASQIDRILKEGAEKARERAKPVLARVRDAVGL